jgi:hypothetical protein
MGLLLGASVLTAAACEEKTPVETDPITVNVSPDAVTIEEGQSVQLVASVGGGDAGTVRTVTWASSNTAVASIAASGNTVTVTGAGEGVATITATATADPSAVDASAITVTADEPSAPATISIKSITFGNLLTPVNTQNVFGQIDVTLNVDVPAGNEVTRVETLIDGNVVCDQAFSGAAAIGVAANPELGTEAQPVEIVCSIQTQAFNSTTGAPTFPNGPHALTARLVGPDGTVVATPSTTLVFNNTNFLNVTVSSTRTANGAAGPRSLMPAGTLWRGGDLTFTVLSVNYGPATSAVSSVSVSIESSGNGVTGVGGCTTTTAAASTNDASADPTISSTDGGAGGANFPGCAAVTAARTVTATPNAAFPVTFASNATLTAGTPGVQNVEDVFEVLAVTSVTSGGGAGPTCINPTPALNDQGPGCVTFFPNNNQIPVDNLAPRVTQLNILRPNQYYNAAFVPVHSTGGPNCGANCPAGSPFARTVDYGVDAQTATSTFSAGVAGSLSDVTAGFTGLPETQTANTNVFSLTTVDALTNSRQVYATNTNTIVANAANNAAVQLFGIDNTVPTQTVTGPPNNSSNCPLGPSDPANCSPVGGWTIAFSDAGVGPSGFNVNPVSVKLERILAGGITCHHPDTGAAISCTTNGGIVADDGIVTLPAPDGYYRLTAFVTDAANNQSTQTVILTLRDYTPPGAGGIASPAVITGGAAVTFSSALTDGVELGDVLGATVFGGAGINLVDSRQPIGTYGIDAIVATSPGTFNVASFVRSVEMTSGAGLPAGAPSQATAFEYAARDVAGVEVNNIIADGCPPAGSADGTTTQNCILRNVNITAAVAAGSPTGFPAYTSLNTLNTANAAHGLFVHQAPSEADVCTDSSCGGAADDVFNTTLSATLTGPAATFANPFSRVVFYMQDANGRWTPIGTASVSLTDNTVLNTRTYTFSFVWTPTGLGTYAAPIMAVGINASGSALLSQTQTVNLTST